MPLSLAQNRFGFMWVEMGPRDWEIYVRIRNLVSSALLRTMLVQQREQAKRKWNACSPKRVSVPWNWTLPRSSRKEQQQRMQSLYSSEQTRRQAAEALTKSARQLSSLATVAEVPQQIVEQLSQVMPNERSAFFLEDVNGIPRLLAHRGLPEDAPVEKLPTVFRDTNVYHIHCKAI